MTKEKYLQYRELFEQRYLSLKEDKGFLGFVNLYDLKKDIYNFPLFLNIYVYDKRPQYSNIVSSIDRRKRFFIFKSKSSILKIKINITNKSLVDTFEEELTRLVFHCKTKK